MTTDAAKVTDYGKWLAAQYGLSVTSQTRTPERNAQVGGAKNSDHLTGMALDLSGSPEKMAALAQWANANTGPGKMFRYVEYGTDDHQDHVHLSFNADASVPTVSQETTVAAATTTGRPDLPPDATPEQVEAYIKQYYPDVAPFLGNAEMKMILYAAAINDWDDRKLDAAIEGTEYWRTHGVESRAFDAMLADDPRRARELITENIIRVDQAYQRQGIKKDKAELGELAKDVIRGGWTDADITRHIARELRGLSEKGTLAPGAASADADTLTARARQYLVPITRGDAENWSLRIMEGTATQETFDAWLTGLAKARWASQPDVLAAIESGGTVGQYFAGHKAQVANLLELDDQQIDLLDPRWSWIVETVDKQGNRRAPTLGEVAQLARDREEFKGTRAYKEQEASYGVGLARFLGQVV